MTSLEGVCRTAVRAADLANPILLSSRYWPLLTLGYGPLMARRSCQLGHASHCLGGGGPPGADLPVRWPAGRLEWPQVTAIPRHRPAFRARPQQPAKVDTSSA
jgi:hypothetical protein